jgi:hypothetical protein
LIDRRLQAEIDAFVDSRINKIAKKKFAQSYYDDATWQDFRDRPTATGRVAPHTRQLERLGGGDSLLAPRAVPIKRDRRLKGWKNWED